MTSEGTPIVGNQMQNGHRVDRPNHITVSGAEEVLPPSGAAIFGRDQEVTKSQDSPPGTGPVARPAEVDTARRPTNQLEESAPGADDLVTLARPHPRPLVEPAKADAAELLSRAQSQAELLRVRAEAMRAEAECLRAEAAALRSAVRDEAEATTACANAVAAQAHAAAEDLRSAMQREAIDTRAEFERMRTEALSVRRLLRAEIDAGLADAERVRGEVQRLWAETEKLAAQLGLLFAQAGPPEPAPSLPSLPVEADEPADGGDDRPQPAAASNGRPVGLVGDALDQATGILEDRGRAPLGDVEQRGGRPAGRFSGPPTAENLAELLADIWDAASGDPRRLPEDRSTGPSAPVTDDQPTPHRIPEPFESPEQRPADATDSNGIPPAPAPSDSRADSLRASQPLIGSGGWQPTPVTGPDLEPERHEPPPSPLPPPRRRRRFHRD